MKLLRGLMTAILLALFFSGSRSFAQDAPSVSQGENPTTTYHAGDFDMVDMITGRLNLHIPLVVDHSQRGKVNLVYSLYFSGTSWYQTTNVHTNQMYWEPVKGTITGVTYGIDGRVKSGSETFINPKTNQPVTIGTAVVDGGGVHHLATISTTPVVDRSVDGSGIMLTAGPVAGLPTYTNKDGIRFGTSSFNTTTLAATDFIQDANGNQLTFNRTASYPAPITMSDTVGRPWNWTSSTDVSKCPVAAVYAVLWDIPGPSSSTREFKYCYSNISIQTHFGGNDYSNTVQLMTGVVLPDNTTWRFDYNSYGDVTKVYLPTGGTITYSWSFGHCGTSGPTYETLYQRAIFDGTNSYIWTYNHHPGFYGGTTVTDPLGNDVVNNADSTTAFLLDCAQGIGTIQYYSGSSTSGGTLLKTVTNTFAQLDDSYISDADGGGSASYVYLPQNTTTTWPNNQSTQVQVTYDAGFSYVDNFQSTNPFYTKYGLPLEQDNYDYTGALLSKTTKVYKALSSDSNAGSYLSANLLSLVDSQTVFNGGGTQMAQTTNLYDESNGSVCTTLPCGDLTSVTRWLNGGTSPKTQYKYNSNGMLTTKCDPIDLSCSNPTAYTYDGTGAYLSQTQYPTTNVAHIEHFIFDSNTGLMTQSTDENGTSNPTNYFYDCMMRPYLITYPDGGQENVTYNYSGGGGCGSTTTGPYTGASYTKKIDALHTLSQNSIFDGLGRPTHTQLTSDPEGTDYTDTTYDADGRVGSVSNPHRSTASSTDGVTQYQYDPLNRVTTVIEPDLSGISTTYSGNCTTVTDEASRSRRSCSDALQRLTEVDEPSVPTAAATPGSGSATVSGSEKLSGGGPASFGPTAVGRGADAGGSYAVWGNANGITLNNVNSAASVTIYKTALVQLSNFLKATNFNFNLPTTTTSINGIQVSITRSGNPANDLSDAAVDILKGGSPTGTNHSQNVNYGTSYSTATYGGSTDTWGSTWAYTDINSNAFGVQLQVVNGSGYNATARVIYVQITVWYTTAGTYDSGTVWVTVNGSAPISATYGQGDTPGSVAGKLATSINSNTSLVTATPNGASVTIKANQTGASTDYSLTSGNSTQYPTLFNPPSFSVCIVSGSQCVPQGALSGGYNAGGPLTASTIYQYDALDNLIRVDQENGDSNSADWRTRTFAYDSLSRLRCAANPEITIATCPSPDPVPDNVAYTQGTIGYAYDANGNLMSKTSPQANQIGTATTTISYCSDPLNRLTAKSYSNSSNCTSPAITYGYDGVAPAGCSATLSITNPKPHRTGMCDALGTVYAGSVEMWSYDQMGRVVTDQRSAVVGGVLKSISSIYGYNFDGSIKTITYPTGRTITYTPSGAGRTVSAIDTANGINYATSALYTPSGALRSVTNGTAVVTNYFNSRLQPCRFAVNAGGAPPTVCGDSSNKGNVMDFTYNFGLGADNGNVLGITNNITAGRSLTATYDMLNRIESASMSNWNENYGIDLWGNLTTISGGENLSQSATIQNRFAGFSYDAAGNLLNDGSTAYTYDEENRLTTAGAMIYGYDGDSKRVAKSTSAGPFKSYWYGMNGDPLEETDGTGSTTNSNFSEYIFFNGKRIARRDGSGNVFYYFTDHLGTSREIVQAGQTLPCYDADFYPFGRESNVYTNTCPQNYKFTGKERDETGLDNFGARYNSSQYGRFMSIDPDNAGAVNEDPQTWNAYSYVRNNPLRYTDPDGTNVHVCVDNEDGSRACFNLTDAQYSNLYQQQNGQEGISLPGGKHPNGNVTCNGGQVCGSAQYFEAGLSDDPIIAPALFGGIAGGIRAGIRGIIEGIFSSGAKTAVEETTTAAAEQVIASGTKSAVKQAIEDAAINDGQKAAVKSALDRAGSTAAVKVEKLADGSLRITTQRAGKDGFQAIEKVVDGSGNTTSVVQKAYDSAGTEVHVDQKFP
jgi:RHS repeat-associated protein